MLRCLCIFCLLFPLTVRAQLLNDTLVQKQVILAIDKIYNFEFTEAEPVISTIRKKYPKHPVSSLLMALYTSWKYFPIDSKSQAYQTYQQYLKESLERTNQIYGEDTDNPEGVFFALSAHSYLALVASEERDYMKAMGEAKRTYVYMKKGFDLMSKYPEFYFTTGLYNFYVVEYPENHSAVKPFMLFFADGDKALGLKQMEQSITTGTFTRTEAAYWLAHIYIKHEIKPLKALQFTQQLINKYPGNVQYIMRHTEMLIATGKYDQAQPYIKQLIAHTHKMIQSSGYVFLGLIQEKQTKNFALARTHFQHAFKLSQPDRRFTMDYYALAYAAMARMSDREGNRQAARDYYKKVLDMAEYEGTIKEAKNYLKNASAS
ncbi:ABC transporter substrate-binding protein [Rhodocytophaga rosea]|uniref:ABC transporter substrate-binding protein n=1 Tax=Rhodocytophaga rosea TaxID=2704465 RepID=A0A6C0GSW9_9BACT|nr:ABC transporter substrate-binding protein [Rhodocytophaga rosea]QHT71239.1 ABC transporter substrate-binding protein [Rhodocytophaga rosea]